MTHRSIPLISDQVDHAEVAIIVRELRGVLANGIPGDVVELGCYIGTTSLFIQALLDETAPDKAFHVYDSFAGLPPKKPQDESPAGSQFKAGELRATKAAFVRNFTRLRVPLPVVHQAWFQDLTPEDMPSRISFAFLDGDFYESITHSLRVITPHLSKGACIVIDDYQSEALPGAAKAADEWLASRPNVRLRIEHSLAIIHIP